MHTLTSAVIENDKIYNRGLGGEIISAGDNYYAYNGHGDTTNLTKQSSGVALAITANYEYDAFGNCLATGGEADSNPFRYNGQYTDSETGLVYLRNRYYDPSIGRLTQEDPVKDGLNWYVYCANDPVNFVDSLGLTITCSKEDYNKLNALAKVIFGSDDFELKYTENDNSIVLNADSWDYDDIETGSKTGKALFKNLIAVNQILMLVFLIVKIMSQETQQQMKNV